MNFNKIISIVLLFLPARRLSENGSGPAEKQLTNEQNPLKNYRRKTI